MTKNLKNLQSKLGFNFQNENLLAQALTHRSFLNEANGLKPASNERLEFLGDAVLSFITSKLLYDQYPLYPEGKLTNIRSNMVRTEALADIARNFSLGEFIFLSKGELESGGQNNTSLLADCLEAVIGAIFLDQGLEGCKPFIENHFRPLMEKIVKNGEFKDFKSLLQEKVQAEFKKAPVYKSIKEEGPDHAKVFTIAVYHQAKLLATAKGKSKQEAEEAAAKTALAKFSLKK